METWTWDILQQITSQSGNVFFLIWICMDMKGSGQLLVVCLGKSWGNHETPLGVADRWAKISSCCFPAYKLWYLVFLIQWTYQASFQKNFHWLNWRRCIWSVFYLLIILSIFCYCNWFWWIFLLLFRWNTLAHTSVRLLVSLQIPPELRCLFIW